MQLRFTVYNCGTAYHRNSRDIVPQLWRETASLCHINDGPGSTGNKLTNLPGMIAGKGVDANVDRAVAEIKRRHTVNSMVLNMTGWSRGAVTCFKIANKLYRDPDPKCKKIKCNIYAIDPVPGGSILNNHMWRNIENTPNIGMCSAIYAQHDRRSLFSPYYPQIKGPFTDIDIMPGDHATIVEDKGRNREAHLLVKYLTKQFLINRGTVFHNKENLTDPEILSLYARVAEGFDDYAKFAKGAGKDKNKYKGERVIRDDQNHSLGKMLPIKPSFFINAHHREVFQRHFPQLTNEIDLPINKAFAENRWNRVQAEYARLTNNDLFDHTAKLVTFFIMGCRAKQAGRA